MGAEVAITCSAHSHFGTSLGVDELVVDDFVSVDLALRLAVGLTVLQVPQEGVAQAQARVAWALVGQARQDLLEIP